MRVLVVASPLTGHVLPLVPLAQALRNAGHHVTVATGGDGPGACPPEPSPTDAPRLRMGPLFLRLMARHPLLARREAAGRGGTRAVGLLFGAVGERMADGVVALADRVRPDLVVHEPLAVAGAEAAARREVPAVLVEGSLFDARELLAAAATHGPARGLTDLPGPADVLSSAPPSLVGVRSGRPMRFVPVAPERAFDAAYAGPGDRPRLLVSRSTVADPRRDRLMTTVVAAADGVDLDVVLVRPHRWVTRRPLPPNVRTTDWLPFPDGFPAAASVVHHGGAGTVLTALATGLPQPVVRGAGDRGSTPTSWRHGVPCSRPTWTSCAVPAGAAGDRPRPADVSGSGRGRDRRHATPDRARPAPGRAGRPVTQTSVTRMPACAL